MTVESRRLEDAHKNNIPWNKWGPYLSERQWGTVREDYSESGNAWDYFTHDQARSRAYRWGEDGLGGICDEKQRLCFALALWNGADPILKERLFGLSNSEANHGEDVKEYYFYLDSTPTHSYMKYLYKYPQAAYPYDNLVTTNKMRSREEFEYELLDTGVFDQDRYFDVFVEYAKEAPEDILIKITIENRGPQAASIHILPTLWFRNTWSFFPNTSKPVLKAGDPGSGYQVITAAHPELGEMYLYCEGSPDLFFTENETNNERVFGTTNSSPYVKDGFNSLVVNGQAGAINPQKTGTKAAPYYKYDVPALKSITIRLRLTQTDPGRLASAYGKTASPFGKHFDGIFKNRLAETHEFYTSITPVGVGEDKAQVLRQALAGMLWTKQYYFFDLDEWLEEHGASPFHAGKRANVRNANWYHMINDDIISMPDKWEYPWYAAWDLAFHTIALSMVDPIFAKKQLQLMLREFYLHPNGQLPAYEWNFGDVNPPVHAWASLFVYEIEKRNTGQGDLEFLKEAFEKLVANFTWWVNRKDPGGKNVFDGGFLGLDNIGVFDRSAKLPSGGNLEQADGTAWMAFFSLNMLEIAMEIAHSDPSYNNMALKFLEHFFWIAGMMDRIGENQDELWDEEDGFFYDVLRMPDGTAQRLKVRSMVGLLPLCANTVVRAEFLQRFPEIIERAKRFITKHPELFANIHSPLQPGVNNRRLLSILDEKKLRRVLERMLDEERFFSPYGIRSLSKWHKDHPYIFTADSENYTVQYLPAESNTGMFGGNSNWRGPVWFPVNLLIIRSLLHYYRYYGDDFKIECPTGSGNSMNLFEVSQEISERLTRIFLRDQEGRRPVYGATEKFQKDPFWRDYILFYEYFHGDNGAGLGASHQTGWTGLVARLIHIYGNWTAEQVLDSQIQPVAASFENKE